MIRLVTLDINNTLLRFRRLPGEEYARVAALYGISADPVKLTTALKQALKQQTTEAPVFGSGREGGWQYWWQRVVQNTFLLSGTCSTTQQQQAIEPIAQQLLHWYSTAEAYSVIPHAHQLVDTLASKNYTLGVISNTDPRIRQVLREHGLSGNFKFVLDAYTAGIAKPHSAIFARAIAEAGLADLRAEEVLHIGDSVRKDYLGAVDAGCQSWLVASDHKKQFEELGVTPQQGTVYESLQQLLNINYPTVAVLVEMNLVAAAVKLASSVTAAASNSGAGDG